jgi:hypothetical protein
MKRQGRLVVAVLVLLVVPLLATACGGKAGEEAVSEPAVAEPVKGTDVIRVTLTAEAAKRLGLRTADVRSDGPGTTRTVIPYNAVLYDPDGGTWTYTNPQPLVFQREDISVARIDGDTAILSKGPPVGTAVVTAGATEIWGVEYGGIEED